MAYLDLQDQQPVTPDAEAESRRKMLMMLAGSLGKPSILGNRPEPSPVMNESQPTVPPPRLTPTAPPSIANNIVTPTAPKLGIPAAQPVRPNVQPMRSDFEAKPELGGWKKVLGLTAGFGLGSAPLVHDVLHGQRDVAERKFGQATQDWERSQTDAARAATTDKTQAEAEALRNPQPKPKEEDWTVVPGITGPNGELVQQEKTSGQVRFATGVSGVRRAVDKPDTETEEAQRYEKIKQDQTLKKPITPEDQAWAGAYEKRKTLAPFASAVAQAPQKSTERSDKSFQFNNSALDKVATPIDQINQRMGRLMDTLNQNTPQADALVAPELLSVMSGGQGSGLRMNEAEIARIVGGRSKWESLKASINKWSLDPKAALSITPEQRQEIRALSKTVQDKLVAKGKILDDARGALIDSDDPKEHRRIVADTKKKLDAIDAGQAEAADDMVDVIAPDGTPGAIPRANLQKALARGYKQQ